MKLIVEPLDGMVDQTPAIRVEGAPPGVPVTLTLETTDAAGHRWRSETELTAGLDPAEPWWSMAFASEDEAPVGFVSPPDRLEVTLRAVAGDAVATATATRRWAAATASPPELTEGNGFRLTSFAPPPTAPAASAAAPPPGVLLVPGFTGTAAVLPRAALLAAHGYRTAVLSYMGEGDLPSSLREIPLETLAAGYRAFAAGRAVDARRIAVLAASVGTGGALATLASFDDLDPRAVVAIAPTHVVWQALGAAGPPPKASSWTQAGEPLPWVPMRGEKVLPEMVKHALLDRFHRHPVPHALHFHDAYAAGLANREAVAAATIEVERIRAPLLLLSGADDQMWPADEMAAAILSRRGRADDEHRSFADAGHFLGPPLIPTTVPWNDALVSGGTAAGNAAAQRDGWQAILGFLARHLP